MNCIVLSGEFRSFPRTKEKIKKFISLNNLDVYCHLWSTNDDESNYIIEELNPKKIIIEDYNNYKSIFDEIETNIKKNNPKKSTIDKLANHASMNFGRKKAFELIGGEYDTLVYCRYDIDFNPIFTFQNIDTVTTPFEQAYNIISDIFCITPFKYSKHYFIYDVFEELHSKKFEPTFDEFLRFGMKYGEENIMIHNEERYCPHMILLRNLINNNVPHEHINYPVSILR